MEVILGMIVGAGIFLLGAYVGNRIRPEGIDISKEEEAVKSVPLTVDGRFYSTEIAMQGLEEGDR